MTAALISGGITLSGLVGSWLMRRRREGARAGNLSARAGLAAAESVDILLEPLNARISHLGEKLAAASATIDQMRSDYTADRLNWLAELKNRDGLRAQMQAEIDELRGGVSVLVAQLEAAGIKPRYKPATGPLSGKADA